MNTKELKAERGDMFALAERLVNNAKAKNQDLAGEERAQFNTLMARIGSLDEQITNAEKIGAANGKRNPGGLMVGVQSEQTHTKSSVLARALAGADSQGREAINNFVGYLRGKIAATATLTEAGDGSVLVPTSVSSLIERDYAQFAPVLGASKVIQTDDGAPFVYPVLSDSESSTILAEDALTGADATVSGDTPPTALTGPTLKAYKFSSKPVRIPFELGTDSNVDIISEVISALIARNIRYQNLKFTLGAGSTEPTGFVPGATAYDAGDHTTVLSLDICLDMIYATPALYRTGAAFMMSNTTAQFLRKLKTGVSGDKRALWGFWQEGNAVEGIPPTLHGHPVIFNDDMASVISAGTWATTDSPVAFGNFSKFLIRRAGPTRVLRYGVPAKDATAAIVFDRSDSKLLVPTAITKLTCHT